MEVPSAVIIALITFLGGCIAAIIIWVKSWLEADRKTADDRYAQCRADNKACEERYLSAQHQIDLLAQRKFEEAARQRPTDRIEKGSAFPDWIPYSKRGSVNWKWLSWLGGASAMLLFSASCASTRDAVAEKNTDRHATLMGTLGLPMPTPQPDGSTLMLPQPVDFRIKLDDVTTEAGKAHEESKSTVDSAEIARQVVASIKATGSAAVQATPAGAGAVALWKAFVPDSPEKAIAAATALVATGVAVHKQIQVRKRDKIIGDVTSYAQDAARATTPEALEKVQDKHRLIQIARGTNDAIKARFKGA